MRIVCLAVLATALFPLRGVAQPVVGIVVEQGTGTPVPGGLTQRETLLLAEILGDEGRVTTLELFEVNPILDEANKTARFAVDIAASLMGERILHPEDV